MKNKHLQQFVFFLVGLTLLASCSVLGQQTSTVEDVNEATVTPIIVPTQLRSQAQVDMQTCLVVEKATIQTNKVQGDLMTWSPQNSELAFVQPVNQYSGWFIGNILIFNAAQSEEVFTSEDQAVFGDLTWSPDGSALAYVGLDQQEGIYTVKVLTLAEGVGLDIFGESARTDDFASLKGIRGWFSASNLTVTSYCGTDCVRVYQYNPVSASLLEQEDIRQNADTSLVVQNDLDSPNGKWLITIDDKNNVWLSDTATQQISLLLTTTPVSEVKWSVDSTYLAIRIADKVMIYQTGCTP